MVGVIGIVFAVIPETPWWLASRGELDKAAKVLRRINGNVQGYDVVEQVVSYSSLFTFSTKRSIMLEKQVADLSLGSDERYGNVRTTACRRKCRTRAICCISRTEPSSISYFRMAEDCPAVCWPKCV